MLRHGFFFLTGLFVLVACTDQNQIEKVGEGQLIISADESFEPVVKAEKSIFESIYNRSKLVISYKSETEAMNDLLADSVEIIVIGRDLNEKERAFFKSRQYPVVSSRICTDALAFVVNESFPDSILHYEDIRKLFSGEIKRWNQLHKSLPDSLIRIILDQSSSSNLQALNNSLTVNLQLLNIYAAGSNKAVTDFVRGHKNSIGIIGNSWVSDREDSQSRRLLEGLKILQVEKGDTISGPYQSDLAVSGYPFRRDVYMITSNKRVGAGTAFMSFVASDRGQRIILKSGLLPATMPGREIKISSGE